MAQHTVDLFPHHSATGDEVRTREREPARPAGDDEDRRVVERLETRVLQLEAEKARLERERLQVQTMCDEIAGSLDVDVQVALENRFRGKHLHLELIRNGRITPIAEVLPESVLDLTELSYWRQAMAQATGLQTLLFLEDDGGRRSAGNSPTQLPVLGRCSRDCLAGVEQEIQRLPDQSGAVGWRCAHCGGGVWAVPIHLEHERELAVLGYLVGHDLTQPAEPLKRMVELVTRMASRYASEEYASQLNTALEMKVATLVRNYTSKLQRSTDETRDALILQEKTALHLGEAKRELETALTSAQAARREAERANRTKSMFLATMSHEIRTPLTCIIGFADLLTLPGIQLAEARDFAESIKESGQVLLSLINNVLDLSKIEAGRLELESIPYDIRVVADEILAVFSPSAREKGVALIPDIAADVPREQLGDPTRVRQVLMNLVSNGLKFTGRGEVRLVCRRGHDEGMLELRVEDTGTGIAADRLPRIFDAFSQAERGTTRKHGGTGLGLDISRKLVQAMGGEISARSVEGEGSSFIFTIPNEMMEQGEGGG